MLTLPKKRNGLEKKNAKGREMTDRWSLPGRSN